MLRPRCPPAQRPPAGSSTRGGLGPPPPASGGRAAGRGGGGAASRTCAAGRIAENTLHATTNCYAAFRQAPHACNPHPAVSSRGLPAAPAARPPRRRAAAAARPLSSLHPPSAPPCTPRAPPRPAAPPHLRHQSLDHLGGALRLPSPPASGDEYGEGPGVGAGPSCQHGTVGGERSVRQRRLGLVGGRGTAGGDGGASVSGAGRAAVRSPAVWTPAACELPFVTRAPLHHVPHATAVMTQTIFFFNFFLLSVDQSPEPLCFTWQSIRLCQSTWLGVSPEACRSANASAARSAWWWGRS